MIVVSATCFLVALVLLALGFFFDSGLALIYASIAVSVLSFVCLGIGNRRRRERSGRSDDALGEGELVPTQAAVAGPVLADPTPVRPAGPPSAAGLLDEHDRANDDRANDDRADDDRANDDRADDGPVEDDDDLLEEDEDLFEDDEVGGLVLVVPGRPRYHVEGCRYLAGQGVAELDVIEAREEGFLPCGVCRPDAALAGDLTDDNALRSSDLDALDLLGVPDADDEPGDPETTSDVAPASLPNAAPVAPPMTNGGPGDGAAVVSSAPAGTTVTRAPAALELPDGPSARTSRVTPRAKPPAKVASLASAKPPSRLRTGLSSGPIHPDQAATPAAGASPAAIAAAGPLSGTVVVVPDRGRFHRAQCRYVRGLPGTEVLSAQQAGRLGFQGCGVCKP